MFKILVALIIKCVSKRHELRVNARVNTSEHFWQIYYPTKYCSIVSLVNTEFFQILHIDCGGQLEEILILVLHSSTLTVECHDGSGGLFFLKKLANLHFEYIQKKFASNFISVLYLIILYVCFQF